MTSTLKIKINQVFEALRKRNLIAKQNHLCCMSCACSDLSQDLDKRKGKIGCVYYHNQDTDAAQDRGVLNIRYFGKEQNDTVGIGKMVKEECEKVGLKVTWDGNPGTTIQVTEKET